MKGADTFPFLPACDGGVALSYHPAPNRRAADVLRRSDTCKSPLAANFVKRALAKGPGIIHQICLLFKFPAACSGPERSATHISRMCPMLLMIRGHTFLLGGYLPWCNAAMFSHLEQPLAGMR